MAICCERKQKMHGQMRWDFTSYLFMCVNLASPISTPVRKMCLLILDGIIVFKQTMPQSSLGA